MPYIPYGHRNYIYAKMHPVFAHDDIRINTTFDEMKPNQTTTQASAEVDVMYQASYVCSVNLFHLSAAIVEEDRGRDHRLVLRLYEDDVYKGKMELEEHQLQSYLHTLVTKPMQLTRDEGVIELVLTSLRTARSGEEIKSTYTFKIHYRVSRFPQMKVRDTRKEGSNAFQKLASSEFFVRHLIRVGDRRAKRLSRSRERSVDLTSDRHSLNRLKCLGDQRSENESSRQEAAKPGDSKTSVQMEEEKSKAEIETFLKEQMAPFIKTPLLETEVPGTTKTIGDKQTVSCEDDTHWEESSTIRGSPEPAKAVKHITALHKEIGAGNETDIAQQSQTDGSTIFNSLVAITPQNQKSNDSMEMEADIVHLSPTMEDYRVECEEYEERLRQVELEEAKMKRALAITQLQRRNTAVEYAKRKHKLEEMQLEQEEEELRKIRAKVDQYNVRTSKLEQDGFELVEVRRN